MRLCSEGRERHIYYKEEKMRIAIIDSGVDKNNNHLKKLDIQGCSLRVCDGCIEKKMNLVIYWVTGQLFFI